MIRDLVVRWGVVALGVALVLALALAGHQMHRADRAELARGEDQRAHSAAAAALSERYRLSEAQTRALIQGALDAERIETAAAQAALLRARHAAVGLRDRAALLASQCAAAPDPAAAQGGAPADFPGDLLADMLGRIDAAAGELGKYADAARIAGQLCVAGYQALKPETQPSPPKEPK